MNNSLAKISRGSRQRAIERQAGRKQISARSIAIGLIALCGIFVFSQTACAGERKGMVAGIGLGYMPYAEVTESSVNPYFSQARYSRPISSKSISILAGYAIAGHHVTALFGEIALSSPRYCRDVNFIGALYSYYFSRSPNSFLLSGGMGITGTRYPGSGYGPNLHFGPAMYVGGGYLLLGHIQVTAAYSVGHQSIRTKKYISLTLGFIAF